MKGLMQKFQNPIKNIIMISVNAIILFLTAKFCYSLLCLTTNICLKRKKKTIILLYPSIEASAFSSAKKINEKSNLKFFS